MEEKNVQVEKKERPAFLSVLCILTYIGSGLAILFSLLGMLGIGALAGMAAKFGAPVEGGFAINSLLVLVFAVASIYGAIMMWKLKKIGFYIYVAAQVLIVAFGWSIFALVFALLFIGLYGLNFKHLE
ncbi:MAG: hypothetical protein U9R54_04595 [Bacteroidota bacterium]|nr:hypothetical protein [Bacteroidota bacterium]